MKCFAPLVLSLLVLICGCISTEPTCKSPYIEYQKGSCCIDANGNGICDTDEAVTTTMATTVGPSYGTTTTPAAISTTLAGGESTCGNNYYEFKSGECCLDINANEVCDSDEIATTEATTTSTSSTTTTLRVIPTIPPITLPIHFDCAQHFTKITAGEMALCGEGGSIGVNPIIDSYGCRADPDYPPADSCPAGTEMNNVYGYAAGSTPQYECYVPQNIGATEAPAGCPINNIECYDGFTYNSSSSHRSWTGGGSAWGCYYNCKADPDPYDSNADWPCTKTGYKPIGGGGGDTCCAKW